MRWVFLAVLRLDLSGNGWEQVGLKRIELSQIQFILVVLTQDAATKLLQCKS